MWTVVSVVLLLTPTAAYNTLVPPRFLSRRTSSFLSSRTSGVIANVGNTAAVSPPPTTSAAVANHDILGPLAAAATRAVEESTGKGGESSGQGRPEWGTWCDEDLFADVREALNRVALMTADGSWPQLWEVAGGEAANATLRIAGGPQWDMLLRIYASPAGVPDEQRASAVRHTDGVLALIKPLLGESVISKLRPSGEVLGVPKTLKKGDRAFLQLGGPSQIYQASTSTAALLEVILRHPIQPSLITGEPLPDLTESNPSLLAAFRDAEAPPPPPPPPPASSSSSAPAAVGGGLGMAGAPSEVRSALATSLSASVGGLEAQLEAVVRRVLASRADPAAARRLGISHVRGILLSGPPGCGKTLLARELARSLGSREPQVVNGPEILDKFVGEAEKKVRELFAPAEAEWEAAGDASALHVIILDEMDAIARKRGSAGGDTSGVRDSVVNQLLAKMDGVVEAANVLVIGLTNRPELIDDALLRPGRLEVKLEVSLPDEAGRRDILRIHTRSMRANGALAEDAACFVDQDDAACSVEAAQATPKSLAALTEHFSGAELAGLVRSAASFALGRAAVAAGGGAGSSSVMVTKADLEAALSEVQPAKGRRDEAMSRRFAHHGVRSKAFEPARKQLSGLIAAAAAPSSAASVRCALLVPEGSGASGDASSLAAWAGCVAVGGEGMRRSLDYVRMVSLGEMLSAGGGASEEARCSALVERFAEARAMRRSMLILEDVDLLLASAGGGDAGDGATRLSPVMLGALRSLVREPLDEPSKRQNGGEEEVSTIDATSKSSEPPCLLILATTAAPPTPALLAALRPIFRTAVGVPLLHTPTEAAEALRSSPALSTLLKPDACEAVAELALNDGPIAVGELQELVESACLEAADGADAHAQIAAVEDRCGGLLAFR